MRLLVQFGILSVTLVLAWLATPILTTAPGFSDAPLVLVCLQGALAALLAWLSRQPPWWRAIHLLFLPLALAALRLDLPPALYLAVLAGLILVFWTTFRGEVPLFLSSPATAQAVLALLPPGAGRHVLDLGAGTGGLLRRLAQARSDTRFTGVEHAPLPYLVARWNARGLKNLAVVRRNLWHCPLADVDVVYVFLSPAVMPQLWRKARAEMRPGALLISSHFPIPEAKPDRVIAVGDRRDTQLYCYPM